MHLFKKYLKFICFVLLACSVQAVTVTPQLSAHWYWSMALRADGTVWGWGNNYTGLLGVGDRKSRWAPVRALLPVTATAIAAGNGHALALDAEGRVWSWGWNTFGELGLGEKSMDPVLRPRQVPGLQNVIAIAAGFNHSLALTRDGQVWGWGWGSNLFCQMGLQDCDSYFATPQAIPELGNVDRIYSGYWNGLAFKTDGTAWIWGFNGQGQLGLGDAEIHKGPQHLPVLDGFAAAAFGGFFSLALSRDGAVWAWGENRWGQLGMGEMATEKCYGTPCLTTPHLTVGRSDVVSIAAGNAHSLALHRDGTVSAFGYSAYSELGLGDTPIELCLWLVQPQPCSKIPRKIAGLQGVVALAGGGFHSLAYKSDGSLWTWGNANTGQLGLGPANSDDCFGGTQTKCKKTPQQVAASHHIASRFSLDPVDFGTLRRGQASTIKGVRLEVADSPYLGAARSMVMAGSNLASAPGALRDSFGFPYRYSGGGGTLGLTHTDLQPCAGQNDCSFFLRAHAQGETGLQRQLLTIPFSGSFARALMLPAYAQVTGGNLQLAELGAKDYGDVPVRSHRDLSWTYVNRGDRAVEIGDIVSDNRAFVVLDDQCRYTRLAPQQSCRISLSFAPLLCGAQTATVQLHSTDPVAPILTTAYTGSSPCR